MALTPCRECKKEVSTGAKSCPHCGAKKPSESATERMIVEFIVLIFIVVFFISFCTGGDETSQPKKNENLSEFDICKRKYSKTYRDLGESFLQADKRALNTCVIERERRRNGVYD
jgi:hypothetical protein